MESLPFFRYLLVLVGAACLLTSCKDDKDDPSDDLFSTYDRKAMLTRIRDNAAVPAFHQLMHSASALRSTMGQLSTTPTAANLTSAQNAWRTTVLDWKRAEVFAFGPAETQNLASGISAEANPTVIDNALAATTPIDQSFIDTRPATAKGLWALESLLFDRAGGSAAVLTRLTSQADAGRRREYLTALATDVAARASAVDAAWANGSYPAQFVEADGNDVTSSLSLLTNASIQAIEKVKNERLGRPLGDQNGGTAQPGTAEGYQSGTSGDLIAASLDGLSVVWKGQAGQPGINGLLDHLGAQSAGGQSLSSAIDAQIATARTHATGDLVSTVDVNRQPVIDLQNDVKQVTVLLKTEAVSKLGVLLTFNDNDGD
jgi:uncharacterized protein